MKGKDMFKKTLIAGAAAAALSLPGIVFAADDAGAGAAPGGAAAAKPEEPKPPYTLTGNFGVYSQYIFRGLTQTGRKPAVQGGFDYAHESGWYAGMWGSNISWLKENFSTRVPASTSGVYGEGGSVELDFYGGYKWSLPQDFTLDLGALYYYYPGSINPAYRAAFPGGTDIPKADTLETYAGLSWKWLTAKYSYSVLDHTFGVAQSRGTGYLDLSANPPLGDSGVTLNLHFGWQKYKGTDPRNAAIGAAVRSNDSVASYKDYKIGLSYALPKDFTVGGYYTKANVDVCGNGGVGESGAGCAAGGPYPNNIGKGTGTVFIQKTF